MADAETKAERAYDQVVEWLEHFEDLDDPRQSGPERPRTAQRGKVSYPLDEMTLPCLLAVLACADGMGRDRPVRPSGSSTSSVGSARSSTARRRMISSAICLPHSIPKPFKVASLPGSHR